jgi:hypothetical protein
MFRSFLLLPSPVPVRTSPSASSDQKAKLGFGGGAPRRPLLAPPRRHPVISGAAPVPLRPTLASLVLRALPQLVRGVAPAPRRLFPSCSSTLESLANTAAPVGAPFVLDFIDLRLQ